MRTILILDHGPRYRALLSQCFQIAGWQVYEAGTGNNGLKLAADLLPDCIICDMEMPNGCGSDVVKEVRADARLQNTEIIMFTGKADAAEREAVLQAGANAYLVKPLESSGIFALVEQLGPRELQMPERKQPFPYETGLALLRDRNHKVTPQGSSAHA